MFFCCDLHTFVVNFLSRLTHFSSQYFLGPKGTLRLFVRFLDVCLYVYFLHPFQEVLQTSAVVMMTVISIDRYIAVMHPFLVESSGLLCRVLLKGPTQSGALLYAFCVIFFSIGITFPSFMDYQVMEVEGLTYVALHWKADFYYCLIYRAIIDIFLRILVPIFVMRRNYSQIYKLVQLWEPEGRRQTLFSMTAVFVVTMLPKVLSFSTSKSQYQRW